MDQNGREERVENGLDMKIADGDNNKHKKLEGVEEGEESVERIFAKQEAPSWRNQLTWRAFGVSFILSVLFSFIVMKLNLTAGVIPSLNVSAACWPLGVFLCEDMDKVPGKLWPLVWGRINKAKADAFAPAVASGLICGDGIWTLPSSILALAGVKAPICTRFFSRATNTRIDNFLGS